MVYITVMQSPIYHQMTLEEFLFQNFQAPTILNTNVSNTRTYAYETVSEHFTSRIDTDALIRKLVRFNEQTEALRAQERSTLYETFHIPKRSGGLRRIDAPKPELMNALRNLKTIFEEDFRALYHTSAFAYVKNRCTVDAVKRHQKNNSKWFGKLDLHDFFGSTTLDYVIKMFSMVFPFSEIVKFPNGEAELRKALDLAFLNGGLPQGTPLSPLITNVMMIPVDYKLANAFRDFDKQRFIYTRYADDFIISSKVDFDVHRVENSWWIRCMNLERRSPSTKAKRDTALPQVVTGILVLCSTRTMKLLSAIRRSASSSPCFTTTLPINARASRGREKMCKLCRAYIATIVW